MLAHARTLPQIETVPASDVPPCLRAGRREARSRRGRTWRKSPRAWCRRSRLILQPLTERGTFTLAHAGLIAERHRLGLHRLRVNCCGVLLEIGDGFQDDIFWRFLETFMRRLVPRGTSRSVCHNRQRFGVVDSKCICKGRGGEEYHRRRRPRYHAMAYGIRMVEPVVSRPSMSLCALAASLSGYFWLIGIFTAPEPTTSNRSFAVATRSSRLAA